MNYAFYKESDEKWTVEEVKHIQQAFPSEFAAYPIYEDGPLHRKWVMYAKDERSGYYMWYQQDKVKQFNSLTQMSYEEFMGLGNFKTYKIKEYDA